MSDRHHLYHLRKPALYTALVISVGLVIFGLAVYLAPKTGDGFFMLGPFVEAMWIVVAVVIATPGLVLLLLIGVTSWRHRALARIGAWVSFLLAVLHITGAATLCFQEDVADSVLLFFIVAGVLAGAGFFCAGFAALTRPWGAVSQA